MTVGCESKRMKENQMTINPETGQRVLPPVLHVFTAIRMFGPDLANHVVPITREDWDKHRLFERKIGGNLGRNFDTTNDVLYKSQTKTDFDRYGHEDDEPVPTIEHESLDAFFKAIGYSWSRNAYKAETVQTHGSPEPLPLAA